MFNSLPIQEIFNDIKNKFELYRYGEWSAGAGFEETYLAEQENAMTPLLELGQHDFE